MSEELEKAVAALRKPWLITENRASVVVYRDDLTLVLDRLEELEEAVAAAPDVDSELEIGDTVATLIRYAYYPEGMEGVVENLDPDDEYPIKVRFPGARYVTGYKRDELGKVTG